MNGIENIKNKILDEANAAKKATLDAARAEADAIKAEAEKVVDREKAALLERGARTADESRKRIVSAAALEQRKAVLTTKQEIIEKAFAMADAKINAIAGEDYKKLLVKLVANNTSAKGEEVLFSAADQAIAADVVAAANKQKGGNAKVSGTVASFEKGVLIKNGNVEVNCSLATLVGYMKEELTADVAKLLFE